MYFRHCIRRWSLLKSTHKFRNIIRSASTEHSSIKDDIALMKYEDIPVINIRNFCIVAHIDHGKSTLADRLLELTSTIDMKGNKSQVLDRLQVEKERGITVKAVTASIQFKSKINDEVYLLNLIDTPGHVDFSNEVGRALTACQSAILLVDANQGIQAQTFANFYMAFVNDLTIIPVLNKVDLKTAKPEEVEEHLHNIFEISKKDILRISAKYGTGVEDLIESIIERAPAPVSDRCAPLRALLFDSWFDKYEGVILLLFIKDGCLRKGDVITSNQNQSSYTVNRIGILRPTEVETGILNAGQVGYITCNMRFVAQAVIGDTFHVQGKPVKPFPVYKPSSPMVFAGLYPVDPNEHKALHNAVEKLALNDSCVTVSPESNSALGLGFRLGFLGILHLEVFSERLKQEYSVETVITAPSVPYKVWIKGSKNIKEYGTELLTINNPTKIPNREIIANIEEPVVMGTILTPNEYIPKIIGLCCERRGKQDSVEAVDSTRSLLKFILPLNEVVLDFHDVLKNITSGYASFDYIDHGYVSSDLVRVDLLLNGNPVEELCFIVHRSNARKVAKEICMKLSKIISRQLFKIAIQAAVGDKVIASETIKPYRKDVTQKLYGGDATRRMKLLRGQSDAKEKMRKVGNVHIPRDTFIQLLKKH